MCNVKIPTAAVSAGQDTFLPIRSSRTTSRASKDHCERASEASEKEIDSQKKIKRE